MGIFRVHKAKDYSEEQVALKLRAAFEDIRYAIKSDAPVSYVESKITSWAEWRELLARIQNDNSSDVV